MPPKHKSLTQRLEDANTQKKPKPEPKSYSLEHAFNEHEKLKTSNSLQDRIATLKLEQD